MSAWSALGTSVVHFLWQGTLVGLAAWIVLELLHERRASTRYAVACVALLLCLGAFAVTFLASLESGSTPVDGLGLQLARAELAGAELFAGTRASNFAAWGWAVGVLCMGARLAVHGHWARRLRTTAIGAPDATWLRSLETLKHELGLTRAVLLLRSGLAEVPMVVGWFSPVILVPAAAFTALSPDQLRALLVHELAHIRRHDHLLNAAQAVVETVLFFHPVVWWISKQVRLEREYCCDDSSVRVTGSPKLLAEALASMEALRIANPTTGIVLASNGGPLMQRITRILGGRLERRSSLSALQLPAGLALAAVLAAAGSAYARPAPAGDAPEVVQDTKRSELDERKIEIEAALAAGEMTKEEAQKALEEVLMRERYDAEQARVKAAVAAGEMTDEEAKRTLEGLAARMKYAGLEARVNAAVKAGDMTADEAKQALEGFRLRLHYASEQARVKAAVQAGEMTDAQAKETLEGLVKRMKVGAERAALTAEQTLDRIEAYRRDRAAGEGANPRIAYAALEARVAAAVKSGEMTDAEAKLKLEQARGRMELAGVIARIEAAVKAGEMTPEQGQERLEGYKKSRTGAKRDPRAEYAAVAEKIRAAVAAGHLTKEEAEKKLLELRRRMAADAEKSGARKPFTREDYRRAEIELEKKVDEGVLTAEDAERRLLDMQKRLSKER
jgi:D-alanyl-D-alanine endopeptidase (penicillin-binding protein 7)